MRIPDQKRKAVAFVQAIESDFEQLAQLRIVAMRESLERIGRFDPARARQRLLSGFSPAHTRHVVVDDVKVGFVVVKPGADQVVVDHFYIHPDHQGQGIGTDVLNRIVSEADIDNLPIVLCALKDSTANRFYQRHGFLLKERDEWDVHYVRPSRRASIQLCRWDVRHIAELAVIANSANIARNMADNFPHPYQQKDAEKWIALMQSKSEPVSWAIEENGRLAGGIGLYRKTGGAAHSARLVYWLGEDYWGRGIASIAVSNILRFAFDELHLVRVETGVFPWNKASARVLTKNGFHKEGHASHSFIKNGQLVGLDLFAAICLENEKFLNTLEEHTQPSTIQHTTCNAQLEN